MIGGIVIGTIVNRTKRSGGGGGGGSGGDGGGSCVMNVAGYEIRGFNK